MNVFLRTAKACEPRARGRFCAAAIAAACLAACETTPPPAPQPPTGLAELLERPAERALHDALRAYDDAQYPAAEAALRQALQAGLRAPLDRALAHKLLAFITCTSEREAECEAAFRAARAVHPAFELTRAEAGHPAWGPVYRRTAAN